MKLALIVIDMQECILKEPSDLKVTKEYSNAFWKTDLERIVSEGGYDLLILAGQAAQHCVLFTYNGAVERGHSAGHLPWGGESDGQGVNTGRLP